MRKEAETVQKTPFFTKVRTFFDSFDEESPYVTHNRPKDGGSWHGTEIKFDEENSFTTLYYRDCTMLGVKRLNRAEATIRIFDKRVELDRGDELKIRFGGESMMSVRNIVVMGEFLGETFLEHLLPWIEKCVEQGKIGQGLSVFNPRRMRVVME